MDPTSPYTEEVQNGVRLFCLEVNAGTGVLRNLFNLSVFLSENQDAIQTHRHHLSHPQWLQLYPGTGQPVISRTLDRSVLQFLYDYALNKQFPITSSLDELVDTFDQDIVDNGSLQQFLCSHHNTLNMYLTGHGRPKLLNNQQWNVLFPPCPALPNTHNFDTTLLSFLFRNIIGVRGPTSGNWNSEPTDADITVCDDLVRLRLFRNEYPGHTPQVGISKDLTKKKWNKFEEILIRLGVPKYRIDTYKTNQITIEEQGKYLNDLKKYLEDKDKTILQGQEKATGERQQLIQGQEKATGERQQLIQGQEKATEERQQLIQGQEKATGERLQLIQGQEKATGERQQLIQGQEKATGERQQLIQGQEKATGERQQLIQGQEKATGERQQLIQGQEKATGERQQLIQGQEKATGERQQLIQGQEKATGERQQLIQGQEKSSKEWQQLREEIQEAVSSYPSTSKLSDEEVKGKMKDFQKKLRSQYKKNYEKVLGISFIRHSQFPMDKIYVPLKMKEQKTEGVWENVIKSYSSYKELFVPKQQEHNQNQRDQGSATRAKLISANPRRMVITGEPGAGKTTQCEKMAYDWATEEEPLKCFDFLLLLKAREFSDNQDITTKILSTLFNDLHDCDKEHLKQKLNSDQYKVLIIIDGYDELQEKCSQEQLKALIWSQLYTNCHLVITTRPWCVDQLKCREIDSILKICEFDGEQREQFISYYFKHATDSSPEQFKDYASDLLDYIRINYNMMRFVNIPLICLMMCLLWEFNQGRRPDSRTSIYTEILKLFKTLTQEKFQCSDIEWNSLICSLQKLAFNSVMQKNSQVIFEKDELNNHEIKAELACSAGILTQSDSRQETSMMSTFANSYYNFIHLSVQEYLAACYIYHADESEKDTFLSMLKEINTWQKSNFLVFIFGVYSHDKRKDILFLNKLFNICQESLSIKGRYDSLNLMWDECGHEPQLQWKIINDATPLDENMNFEFGNVIDFQFSSEIHKRYLPFLRKHCTEKYECQFCILWNLMSRCESLSVLEINLEGEHMICNCQTRFKEAIPSQITELVLCNGYVPLQQYSTLIDHLRKLTSLKRLNLSHNKELGLMISKVLSNLSPSVTYIALQDCGIKEEHVEDIAAQLPNLTSLSAFIVSHNKLGEMAHHILRSLPPSVTDLVMCDCEITEGGAKKMACHLSKLPSLTRINLTYNPLGHGAANIFHNLPDHIEEIIMIKCNLTDSVIDVLIQRDLTCLKELAVYLNHISDDKIEKLKYKTKKR